MTGLRGCSSAGRARGLQPRGQGFDPPQLHGVPEAGKFSLLFLNSFWNCSQQGERGASGASVRGSNPLSSTKLYEF